MSREERSEEGSLFSHHHRADGRTRSRERHRSVRPRSRRAQRHRRRAARALPTLADAAPLPSYELWRALLGALCGSARSRDRRQPQRRSRHRGSRGRLDQRLLFAHRQIGRPSCGFSICQRDEPALIGVEWRWAACTGERCVWDPGSDSRRARHGWAGREMRTLEARRDGQAKGRTGPGGGRAGAIGGGSAGSPRRSRMRTPDPRGCGVRDLAPLRVARFFRIASGSVTSAISARRAPQAQRRASTCRTRSRSSAQL